MTKRPKINFGDFVFSNYYDNVLQCHTIKIAESLILVDICIQSSVFAKFYIKNNQIITLNKLIPAP